MNEKELKFIQAEKERVKKAKQFARKKLEREGIRNENKRDVNIRAIQEFWDEKSTTNVKDRIKSELIIGSLYIENETKLIWELVNYNNREVELENYDTTYCITIEELLSDFTCIYHHEDFNLDDLKPGSVILNNGIEFLFANVGVTKDTKELLYNLIDIQTGQRIFFNPVTLEESKRKLEKIPGNTKFKHITKIY